jgi:hypothetical protein
MGTNPALSPSSYLVVCIGSVTRVTRPLRVNNRHSAMSASRLLYPRKRTFLAAVSMSASGHKRHRITNPGLSLAASCASLSRPVQLRQSSRAPPLAKCSRWICHMFPEHLGEISSIESVSPMTLFDRACMRDCTAAGGIGRVVASTSISWIAFGILRGACNWIKERCGPGSVNCECGFERNEASRDPRHCNHTSCTASATGARCQTFGSRGRGSRGCGSRARGGDHRETHTWRSRPG